MYTRSIILGVLISLRAMSQTWGWSYSVSPHGHGEVYSDNFGNIYTHGVPMWLNGWVGDSIFVKYDNAGSWLWQINYPSGAKISAAACAADTFVYVVGNFTGTVVIDSYTLASRGSTDIFVHKLTASGATMWVKSIGSKRNDEVNDVCADGPNVTLCGYVGDTTHLDNFVFPKDTIGSMFLFRLDVNGGYLASSIAQLQLSNGWPVDYSNALEIERDPAGNFAMIVQLAGFFKLDTAIISGFGSWSNQCVIKLSPNLQFQWKTSLTSGAYNSLHDLVANSQGELFILMRLCGNHGPCSDELYRIFPNGSFYGSNQGFSGWGGIYTTFSRDINSLALDSCDNLYFTGCNYVFTYSAGATNFSFTTGQLSPNGLQLNWIINDTSVYYRAGYSIAALAVNKCVVNSGRSNSANSSSASPQFLSSMQATVGLPVNATSPQMQAICGSTTAVLSAISAGMISWFLSPVTTSAVGVGSTFTTPVLPVGTYTFYAEASTCSMTTGRIPVTVTINPNPTVSVASGTVCLNKSFTIQPIGAVTYTYSGGSAVVAPSVSTIYTIAGANSAGCTHSATCSVYVMQLPAISVLTTKNFMCKGDSAILIASGALSYTWTGGPCSGSMIVSPAEHTYYYVSGMDGHGCVGTASITQFVTECTGLPDIASPGMLLYPNPATDWLRISSVRRAILCVVNVAGDVVFNAEIVPGDTELSLASLESGVYFLKDEYGSAIGKIVRSD